MLVDWRRLARIASLGPSAIEVGLCYGSLLQGLAGDSRFINAFNM